MIKQINELIQLLPDKGEVSDGFHSFKELYDHRIALFIALCNYMDGVQQDTGKERTTWKSKKNSDGSEWDGWFVMGIGHGITYHLPISEWRNSYSPEIEKGLWDGHGSQDVLKRLYYI